MPNYEYYCTKCGEKFEELHRMSESSGPQPCPACNQLSQRVMSPWGRVIFAGFDTVIGHDGKVLSRRQSIDQTPMMPEKVHGGTY